MFDYIKKIKLSRLTKPENSEYDGTQKQNIVLSQLALLVALITFIHLIDDLVAIQTGTENIFLLSLIEGALFAISILTYFLNESGQEIHRGHSRDLGNLNPFRL